LSWLTPERISARASFPVFMVMGMAVLSLL
jgi:hypothetical protein